MASERCMQKVVLHKPDYQAEGRAYVHDTLGLLYPFNIHV